MLFLLLAIQVVTGDSVYSSPGLRDFISNASAVNRTIPPALAGYRAVAETDVAILIRTGVKQEQIQQLEQMESRIVWQRSGALEQRVVGYRTMMMSSQLSVLSFMRHPWVIPTLYGERLRFLAISPEAEDSVHAARAKPVLAIHPLAADREAVYYFSGGDTAVSVKVNGRVIRVVHVHVNARHLPASRSLVFNGDMYFDADRLHIVRMHGEFAEVQAHPSIGARVASITLQAIAFADLENSEFDGAFWLPTYQRLEIQVRSKLATEFRPVFRVITHLRDHEVMNTGDVSGPAVEAGREKLTFAPHDSVSGFKGWAAEIGTATTATDAMDFDDVAPPAFRTTGSARLDLYAEHTADLFRFNRVEGVYTGLAGGYSFRDAAPGLTLYGKAGYAWTENTIRGGITARALRGSWRNGATVERTLAQTNDFVPSLEGDATASAITATVDDYDYVDRWSGRVFAARELGATHAWLLSGEAGPGYDRSEVRRVLRGLIHFNDSIFHPNRPALEGGYMREMVSIELHPSPTGEYVHPGIGLGLQYERGDGRVQWQRIDARASARHINGNVSYAARMDGALLFGGAPPQKIIEIGDNEGLPGYGYKAFGGDRAVLLRGGVTYNFPVLQAPLHVWRLILPNAHPGLGISLQGGWTDASTQAARNTLALFGYAPQPGPDGLPQLLTRPTGAVRSTFAAFITLFNGAAGIGVARPLGVHAPWRLTFGGGGGGGGGGGDAGEGAGGG